MTLLLAELKIKGGAMKLVETSFLFLKCFLIYGNQNVGKFYFFNL